MHETQTRLLRELELSRAIVRAGDELVPRFTITTPETAIEIFYQAPDDPGLQRRVFKIIHDFMVWKFASDFIVSSELREPDAIVSFHISDHICTGFIQIIHRHPVTFEPPKTLDRSYVGKEFFDLLPRKFETLDASSMEAVRDIFLRHDAMPHGTPLVLRVTGNTIEAAAESR